MLTNGIHGLPYSDFTAYDGNKVMSLWYFGQLNADSFFYRKRIYSVPVATGGTESPAPWTSMNGKVRRRSVVLYGHVSHALFPLRLRIADHRR